MSEVDPQYFKATEKDGIRLIVPLKSTIASNEAWHTDNVWHRSRAECIKNGDTISQGFGKFFNLGQGPEDLKIDAARVLSAIHNNERVVATLKYDGSLLIRSVYKDKVMFRTRGSLGYAHSHNDKAEEELTQLCSMYPKLLDPAWEPNRSLLFEWLTPNAQIVILYDELDLRLLAGVDHGHRHYTHLQYLTMDELEIIGGECGIQLTEYHTIESVKDWHHFYRDTLDHPEIEGYVLRLDNEQKLVKVKSAQYLAKHGIRSNLSFKSMVEFWLQHGKEGVYHSILQQLENIYDEEIVMWALPFVDNLFVAVDAWNETLDEIKELVAERRHWPRKDFALEMKDRFGSDGTLFGLAMLIWEDQEPEDKMIRKFMMRFDQGIPRYM